MANKTENLLTNNNVKQVLYDTGYTDTEIERIITEARDGNTERL
jgi:hypothetical protein